MSMIVKHPRLAAMTLQSEEIRKLGQSVCDGVVLDSDDGETTAVTHYPDGRVELQCQGDSQAFANTINNAGSYPDDVEPVKS
jgi:hypothetical protein